jgi:phage terminase small subunit
MAAKKKAAKRPAKKRAAPQRTKAGSSREETKRRKANFIEAYIANGGNATQAAVTAGYSERTAKQQGSRLLTDVDIKAVLDARARSLADRYRLNTENVLKETARIAFFDVANCFGENGALLDVRTIPEDTRRALSSVEVVEMSQGPDSLPLYVKKIRVSDKNVALERAFKHLGLFREDNEQLGKAARRFFEVPRKADK